MIRRALGLLLALALAPATALAQTTPNWTRGYQPTAGEWNALWASKQDYLGAPLLLAGGTMIGKLVTATPNTSVAGLGLPHGSAPTTPTDGDLWTTTAGLFVRINGATVGPLAGLGGGAALTRTDDTNVTLTLAGSPTTALLAATSITVGWSGTLGLTRGGCAAALTASLGGIVYSTASACAILPGTATAGQMLRSGASAAPTWSTATFPNVATGTGTLLRANGTNWVASTATYPDTATGTGAILRADGTNWSPTTATYPNTVTVNRVLWASATNVISDLATANGGILNTSSGGVPSITPTPVLGVAGTTVGSIGFQNATSGTVTLAPVTGALGANTMSIPAATDTIVGKATTDTFTNKTYDTLGSGNVFRISGVQLSAVSGTGSVVLATAPTVSGALLTGTADVQQAIKRSGDISPTALSGDVNDYAPTGFATASVVRQDGGAANRNITGLAGGADGLDVVILNIGTTNNLVLKNESASSTAANRFTLGGDVTIGPGQSAHLWYDSTSSRWRAAATFTVSGGAPTGTVQSVVCGTVTITLNGTCDNGVLLETLTASASASLTTSATLSAYNRILFVIEQYVPATDDTQCRMRVNVGGVQTTNYNGQAFAGGSGTGFLTTFIPCSLNSGTTAALSNVAANGGMSARIWMTNAGGTSAKKVFDGFGGYFAANANFANITTGGMYIGGNGAITNVEFSQNSGNITSGTVKVYGYN